MLSGWPKAGLGRPVLELILSPVKKFSDGNVAAAPHLEAHLRPAREGRVGQAEPLHRRVRIGQVDQRNRRLNTGMKPELRVDDFALDKIDARGRRNIGDVNFACFATKSERLNLLRNTEKVSKFDRIPA